MKQLPSKYAGAVITLNGNLGDMLEDYHGLLVLHRKLGLEMLSTQGLIEEAVDQQDTEKGLELIYRTLPELMNKIAPAGTTFKEQSNEWGFHEDTVEVVLSLTLAQRDLAIKALLDGEVPYACRPVQLNDLRRVRHALEEMDYGTVDQES